jgi:low temperature requirement protein LtrA
VSPDVTDEARDAVATRARPVRESWTRPPRLRTAVQEGERHATWLELFFDLIFVVAIAQLSHELVEDHSLAGFARFGALFVPVWVAWQGFSAYADRFDTDDLAFRVKLFIAMLAIAALAILIPDVWHGEHTIGFALSYIALRVILLGLYQRAYRSAPAARPLIRRYGAGYSLAVGIWFISLAVPEPERYVLWGIALAVDLSLPPLSTRLHRLVPTHGSHLPERWGLFTIIAFGESIVAVALGTSEAGLGVAAAVAGALGFLAVTCLWWVYFDGHEGLRVEGTSIAMVIYSYAHLPLLIGLAAVSAGLSLLIEEAADDHMTTAATVALAGGSALYLLAVLAAQSVTRRAAWPAVARARLGAIAACSALVPLGALLPPVATVAILLALLVALVAAEGTFVRAATQHA